MKSEERVTRCRQKNTLGAALKVFVQSNAKTHLDVAQRYDVYHPGEVPLLKARDGKAGGERPFLPRGTSCGCDNETLIGKQ